MLDSIRDATVVQILLLVLFFGTFLMIVLQTILNRRVWVVYILLNIAAVAGILLSVRR